MKPACLVLAPLVLGLLASVCSAAQDAAAQPETPPPAQDAPVAVPVVQDIPVIPAGPADVNPGLLVSDIDAHRIEPLRYVRRMADVVQLELPPHDVDADVLFLVGQEPVLREEYQQRMLMYLGLGAVDQQLTRLVTMQEIARRAALGEDISRYTASEADLDAKLEEVKEMVSMSARQTAGAGGDPSLGPVAEEDDPVARAIDEFMKSIDASVGMPKYREMLGAEFAFESVFLPIPKEATGEPVWNLEDGPVPADDPKPDWMPQITWDALSTDESGRNLRQFVKSSAAGGGEMPSFFKSQILTRVRSGVMQKLGVHWFFDTDLPTGVFARLGATWAESAEAAAQAARNALAEGVGDAAAVASAEAAAATARAQVTDVTTQELWFLVGDQVKDADVQLVLRELLTLRGMRRALEAAGRWLSDADFQAAWRAEEKKYEGTLLPLTAMIVFRGYDSLDRFREHFRYRVSYRQWREETMTEEELDAHYRAGGRLFFERGNVLVEMAYRGTSTMPYELASFEQAEGELMGAFAAMGADGESPTFGEIAAGFPKPVVRQVQGDDKAFQRNPLRMRMTESELSILLHGYSLADDVFYHGHPGELFGPWHQVCRRHTWGAELNTGVWFVKVTGYAKGRPLAPMEGTNLEQAKDDFLDLNYIYWSQECLKVFQQRIKPAPKPGAG